MLAVTFARTVPVANKQTFVPTSARKCYANMLPTNSTIQKSVNPNVTSLIHSYFFQGTSKHAYWTCQANKSGLRQTDDRKTNMPKKTKHVSKAAFTHTLPLSHRNTFYTETLLHTHHFIQRRFKTQTFYTQKLLHTETSTQMYFYTQILLHTNIFTQKHSYTQTLLHRYTFTHKSVDAQTLLHSCTCTHEHFYTQTSLHRNTPTHKHVYTQTLLHTEAFTHKHV